MPEEWTWGRILHERINLDDVEKLAIACGRVLSGYHPALQGVVLAELLATWVKGHPANMREELLLVHIEQVRELLE